MVLTRPVRRFVTIGVIGGIILPLLVPTPSLAQRNRLRRTLEPVVPGSDRVRTDVENRAESAPVEPFEPREPRTARQQGRVEAIAWFMTGRLKEERNDTQGALEAYSKAVELDPSAIQVYRQLVPLAFSLEKFEDAVKYALKAIELDPEDYLVLRRLAVFMAGRGKPAEAIRLLEQATQSTVLNKTSTAYVVLMRDLAVLYRKTGQQEPAADHYETVFDALQNPEKYNLDFRIRTELLADDDSSYEAIGQTFLDANRPELAIEAFQRAAEERRGNPGSLSFNLAKVYFQTGKPQDALAELQKYLDAQLQSKGREAYQLLADILSALERSDELLDQLQDLAAKDAHNTTLQYFVAEQYLLADRLEDAENLFKKTLEKSGDARGYLGLASVYRRQSRPAELLDTLARAIEGGRELSQIESEMKAITGDEALLDGLLAAGRERAADDPPKISFAQSYVLARLAVAAKRTTPAVNFYELAIAASPDKQRATARLYQELSEYLFEVEAFAPAAEILEKAVTTPEMAPLRVTFLFRLSQAHEMDGKTDSALSAIREALKLNPDAALLHFQEAWIHYHSRQWDESIRLFNQVVEKFPQEADLIRRCQFSISNVYVQQGDIASGERILEKILENHPDDPSVNNDLGYLYADQGKNLEQAEGMIRKALDAEPENAAYLDSMGWVLFKLKRFEEAIPFLEKASVADDATIWDHLGDIYLGSEKVDKAVESWQRALERAEQAAWPDEDLIERIREKLNNQKQNTGNLRPESPDSP